MKKAISLLLIFAMILPLCCSCGSTGTAVMSLGSAKITDKMLVFWLSRYKAQFEYAYGSAVKTTYGVSDLEDFWKMEYDSDAGTTYDDLFTSYIYENAKTYLCAIYLFDEFGLKLSDDDIEEVDSAIEELVDAYADGDNREFNVVLAEYGFNKATLRECYLVDKKVSALENYLFNAGGPEEITDETLENYYQENFVRMEQICIFINQCPETDDDGKYLTDDDGSVKYRDMTAAETQEARDRAQEALTKINAGTDFDTVAAEYNENTESDTYVNGIYMSEDSMANATGDLSSLYTTLESMSLGEVKLVELTNSIHIIKRLSLDAGAWKQSVNDDFFNFYDSSTGGYVTFKEYLKTPLFLEYIETRLSGFSADIKTNDSIISETKISTVTANYYF